MSGILASTLCAQCGRDDQVQAVTSIYQGGRVRQSGLYHSGYGAGAYEVTSTTDLAAALAPTPRIYSLIVGLLTPFLGVFRIRKTLMVRRGLPAAMLVWNAGRYCHRCGVVSLEGQAMSPLAFRQRVWDAGGYGNFRS